MPAFKDATAYGQEIERCFQIAAKGSVLAREFVVAGHSVRLQFASAALVDAITPALAHLSEPSARPELTVQLFDSATSGVRLPFPSPEVNGFYTAQEPWLFNHDSFHILLNPRSKTLTLLDTARRAAFFWTEDAKRMLPDERSFPLAQLWQWWLEADGLQMLHGGAVATEQGAVVLMGASGSGKSTAALACLDAGFDYLGDDLVMIRPAPTPTVYSLYRAGKLDARQLAHFPSLATAARDAEYASGDKTLLWLNGTAGARLRRQAPVRAILLPHVAGRGHTYAERIGAGNALRAATSTLQLIHGSRQEQVSRLAQFVQQVPCYRLELGTELAEVPHVIRNLFQELDPADE